LIGRARPLEFAQTGVFNFHAVFNEWNFQSFPSGHTTTAMATALVVGFLAPQFFKLILLIALSAGISRVVIGMHYPTDVIAGFVLGALGAYAVRNLYARHGVLFANNPDGTISFKGVPDLRFACRRVLSVLGRIAPLRPLNRS
jgi:membrane-associated phospholipid phosphatase